MRSPIKTYKPITGRVFNKQPLIKLRVLVPKRSLLTIRPLVRMKPLLSLKSLVR